jgi:fructokinase
MAFDTDVNAPAMYEFLHARQYVNPQITSCAYITVGTGVGIGLVVNGKPVHGLLHPEAGHIP